MTKKKLIIDFDDTICSSVFLPRVNSFLNTNYKIDDFEDYLIDALVPEDRRQEFYEKFFETNPYDEAHLLCGAKESLKKLNEVYDIYVCSACLMLLSPKSSAKMFSYKFDFLLKKLPFLDPNKFIFTSSKDVVCGDVMIDDYLHNLKRANTKEKYLFSSYHNKSFSDEELEKYDVKRVNSWKEICDILLKEA